MHTYTHRCCYDAAHTHAHAHTHTQRHAYKSSYDACGVGDVGGVDVVVVVTYTHTYAKLCLVM